MGWILFARVPDYLELCFCNVKSLFLVIDFDVVGRGRRSDDGGGF